MEAPFGYRFIDGKLIADELEAEIVKWISDRHSKYQEHPPKELVERIIEETLITEDSRLSYEEAEQKVSYQEILEYMTREVNLRQKAFELYGQDKTVRELKQYLECPYDDLNVKRIEEDYKKRKGSLHAYKGTIRR